MVFWIYYHHSTLKTETDYFENRVDPDDTAYNETSPLDLHFASLVLIYD